MNRTISINRRTFFQGTGAAALVALLAACGSDSEGSTSTGGSGGDFKKEIDKLTVAFPSSLVNLYPGKEAGIVNYFVGSLVLEGLLAPSVTGELTPAVAQSWEQSSPTTFVYTLRSDAKFSDGSAITVDDVLYSFKLAQDEEVAAGTAYYLSSIKSVKKTGDNQVTVTLPEADSSFASRVTASSCLWLTAERFVASKSEVGTPKGLITGTGPYKVTSFTPDSGVTLERVDTWWGGAVPVKTVEIKFIAEEQTRLLARQAGDIDIAVNISLDQVDQWTKTDKTKVLFAPNLSYVGIDFNTAVEPFDDIHVRRAVAHATNRAGIVKSILGGHAQVATALSTPEELAGVLGQEAAEKRLASVVDLPYDLEAAKAELAQSKVPNGFKTTVGVSSSAPSISLAWQAIAEDLKSIGIDVTVKEMPLEQWFGTIASPDYGLAYMDYTNTTGDPADLITWFFGEGNPASYSNPEVAALMAKVKAESDPAARAELIVQAQEKAAADLPYLPLWWGEAAFAVADTIEIADFGPYTLSTPWTPRIKERA